MADSLRILGDRRREVAPFRAVGAAARRAGPRGAHRFEPLQPARGRARRPRRPPAPGGRPAPARAVRPPLPDDPRAAARREGGQAGRRPLALPPPVRLLDGPRRARAARRQPVGEGRDRRRVELARGRGARANRDRRRPRARVRRQLAGARGRLRPARRRPREVPPDLLARPHRQLLACARRPLALARPRLAGRRGRLPLAAQLPPVLERRHLPQGVRGGARGDARAAALLHRRRRLDARRVRQPREGARDRAVHGGARRPRRGASRRERLRRLRRLARGRRLLPRLAARDDGERRPGHRRPRAVDGRVDPERPRRRARRAARRRGRDGGDAQARPRPGAPQDATASGTCRRCTPASATRPHSSSRSTARCSAGEARPRARLRRRGLRARAAPHGRGQAPDDLAARA